MANPPDKTLGGVRKQTFMPNLGASRNKKQGTNTTMDRLLQQEEQVLPERERGGKGGRGRGGRDDYGRGLGRGAGGGSSSGGGAGAAGSGGRGGGGGGGSSGGGGGGSSSSFAAVRDESGRLAPGSLDAPGASLAMPVKMDVDEEADDGVSVAPNSELSALDRSWYLDEDAPLALPMRPFPNGYGTYHGTGSRSTSRAPSRAASRAARSPLPNFRGAPSPWQRPGGLAGIGEDGDGFPPSSAAAVLFASAGIADISDAAAASDSSPGVSGEARPESHAAHAPAPPPLFFFQLPTSLPLKPGAPLDGKPSGGLSGPDYLAALARSGGGTSSSGIVPVPTPLPPAAAAAAAAAAAEGHSRPTLDPQVSLGDLGSGQLGELVVHKSGKVCLQIGGLMLEVQPGTVCSHHQEVVTMGMPEQEGGSVELHRLGPMHDRLVVTPNIDELLGLRR